jgi:hypothetical protein
MLLFATLSSTTATYHNRGCPVASGCPSLVLFEKILPLEKGFLLEIR